MRKMLVAALLAGCSLPAQAGLYIEMEGVATAYFVLPDYSWQPLYKATAFLHGYCAGEFCEYQPSSDGFSLSSFHYHAFSFQLDFTYDPVPSDPYDGVWHDGNGSGLASNGYIAPGYEFWSVDWSSARLMTDDEIILDESPWIDFTRIEAPEPGIWAMMIGGFALCGAALRRRGKVTVSYA